MPNLQASPVAACFTAEAFSSRRKPGSHVDRTARLLAWRQTQNQASHYVLQLQNGRTLRVKQLQRGEVEGLGTGATVWPAAVCLAKHLEKRYGPNGLRGQRGVDLGSGTGFVGLVAANLGADIVLTDQEQLLFLMQENADAFAAVATAGSSDTDPSGKVTVSSYEWGGDNAVLQPPLDFILVSDCILPKLYPIEPLVDALDRLSGPETLTLVSYEHRHFDFDPRDRFWDLCAERGLAVTHAPAALSDPLYSVDDIEIWEVRRAKVGQKNFGESDSSSRNRDGAVVDAGAVVVRSWGEDAPFAEVSILGKEVTLLQNDVERGIGAHLWPSAVLLSRHLAALAPSLSNGTKRLCVLELGAGIGLVAAAAAHLGCNVVATDREAVLPLLRSNVERCCSYGTLVATENSAATGRVAVLAYEWGTDTSELLNAAAAFKNAESDAGKAAVCAGEGETATEASSNAFNACAEACCFDLVLCADCLYASGSVEPLLKTLLAVCGSKTKALLTNELRSSLETFERQAREHFDVLDVPLRESDMVVNRQHNAHPAPLALKRLVLKPPSTAAR